MKLRELDEQRPAKQTARVFESYFQQQVQFDKVDRRAARQMLGRVRNLLAEHRAQPAFHHSEKNPAYLKLVMLEQGLVSRLGEQTPAPAAAAAPTSATPAAATSANQTPQQAAALQAKQIADRKKSVQDQIKQKQEELRALQQELSSPTTQAMTESRLLKSRIRILESEVQQAQVVLAAQDMVDKMQGMIEDVTSMQFKDLPALVDQIKNEVGQEQSTQFNADATAALGGLVQNLQASKTQLESAVGVVTGQPPAVATMAGDASGIPGTEPDLAAPALPEPEAGAEPAPELDAELDEPAPAQSLGRTRR
jgi:hypothetical protein